MSGARVGDRVRAVLFGVERVGTVEWVGQHSGRIVFVRWDHSGRLQWQHVEHLSREMAS